MADVAVASRFGQRRGKRVGKRRSKRLFSKTSRVRPENVTMRGGTRL